MFGALSAGLTGTPSMSGFKSKGEALKYAIEFATQWKDGEKTINYPAAEELYNFICKHVELPKTFDDGLSSFFQRVTETIEEEKRNREKLEELKNSLNEEAGEEPDAAKKDTHDEMMEKVCEDEEPAEVDLTVEGIVEGEQPVNEEEPGLWDLYGCIAAHAKAVGLKLHMGHGGNGEAEEVYCLDGHGEYLQVTLKYSIAPKPEKE